MANSLEQEVKEMISRLTGLEPSDIHKNDDLFNDLGVDSLKIIEIATQIERTYKMVIKDSQLMKLRTIKDTVDLLEKLLEKKNV